MKGEWFCLPLDGQLAIKLSQRVVNIFKQWIQLTYNYSPFKTIISLISHACSIHIHVKYSYSQFKYLKIKNLRKTKEFYLDFQRCKARGNVLNCKLVVGSGGGGIPTYIARHVLEDKTWRGRGKMSENTIGWKSMGFKLTTKLQTFLNFPTFNCPYIYIYIFDNLGCSGQRSVDTRTSTNPIGTRNTLLATCTTINARLYLRQVALRGLELIVLIFESRTKANE